MIHRNLFFGFQFLNQINQHLQIGRIFGGKNVGQSLKLTVDLSNSFLDRDGVLSGLVGLYDQILVGSLKQIGQKRRCEELLRELL